MKQPRDRRWDGRGDGLLVALGGGLAARLARPLGALGVDGRACAELVRTRLRLDQRGPPGLALGPAAGAGGDMLGIGLVLMLCLFWLAGLGLGVAAVAGLSGRLFIALISGATFGLFGLQLVLFYGALLLDPTDIGVLHSRPVSGRTLFAARLLHVGTYLLCGCAALSFFPALLGCLAFPALAVLAAVPLTVAGSALLALGLVALAYALLLRLVGPARFQRVALWVQIATGTLMMGGLQLVGPALQGLLRGREGEVPATLLAWLPPLHFAALFELLAGTAGSGAWQAASLALLLPPAALAAALAVSGRHFLAGLAGQLAPRAERGRRWPDSPLRRLGARLGRTREERAAFDFALALSRRDRIFLRQAVPAALGLGLTGLALAAGLRVEENARLALPFVLPACLYFAALGAPALLEAARFGEHWPARWILQALPVSGPRPLLRGAVLALLLGWTAPVILLDALVLAALAPDLVPALAVALAGTVCLALFAAPALELRLPFTDQPRPNEVEFRNVGAVFLLSGLVLAAGGLQALAQALHPAAPLALGVAWLALLPRAWRGLERLRFVDGEARRPRRSG